MSADPRDPATVENRTNTGVSTDVSHRIGAHVCPDAQLPVVLFRSQARLLRFRPEDGLHILVRGRVSVYEQRGQMQLVAETMEPVGAGSLQLAFEELKEKLKAEGLFNTDRKRPLPPFPRTVGIVTSPTGAVIRDFLNIVARRHSGLNVLLCPVSVQGEFSAGEVEAGQGGEDGGEDGEGRARRARSS